MDGSRCCDLDPLETSEVTLLCDWANPSDTVSRFGFLFAYYNAFTLLCEIVPVLGIYRRRHGGHASLQRIVCGSHVLQSLNGG